MFHDGGTRRREDHGLQMSELLLELLSEEIPARMQQRASDDLRKLVIASLTAEGLSIGEAQSFATPRRLTLHIQDVGDHAPAVSQERKGPRVDAPEKAIAGFLRGAGLSRIEDAEVVTDPKKGDFYVARRERPGRPAAEIIAEVVPDVMRKFPWPKSMRWGDGAFQWVRPLKSIVCLLGGSVVDFEIAGVASGTVTQGHRFHGRGEFTVKDFADYKKALEKNKVLLDPQERQARILNEAEAAAKSAKLKLIDDPALIAENAGLTEWPVVYLGTFDKDYLEVPAECLTTAMKMHQKCFSLTKGSKGKLSNHFLAIANLVPKDGGTSIVSGNEKVINARLADAKFFWDQDLKKPLDEMASKLSAVTFHEKLGTQADRVERIANLAFELAGSCDANPEDARRAAQLSKADLVSGMVGEFPELQGLMGRRYAEHAGTKPEIARAVELHYKPKGPSDQVPREEEGDAVACAVALADKLDTLVGFWAIGEKPTGSGDPYQLRRAALGVIRILLENDLRLALLPIFERHATKWLKQTVDAGNLLSFFADRLKVHLRDQGARHDLIDAVFALEGQDDLALVAKRVEALGALLETDEGANLLAGVKRASNILAIEEKKDGLRYSGKPQPKLLKEPAEKELATAMGTVASDIKAAINVENFTGAMNAVAELRPPIDAFFETVTVNADDKKLRENRLKMLAGIREATSSIADFSKISGG